MDYSKKILIDIEIHAVDGIRECFQNGVQPNDIIEGQPLMDTLINMYFRSPKFKECVQAFLDFELEYDDKVLLAILLDDADALERHIISDQNVLSRKYMLDCTFTPLYEVSLLHICAEYNHLSCAKILVKYGANINEKAGIDSYGFGGQTPIFHTVNQHNNACMDVLMFLLDHEADLSVQVKGLIWGKGYDWETFIPDVNPISYAMMGLLPQFHRSEVEIYDIISLLVKTKYNIDYTPTNIPNKYLSN